MSFLYFSSGVPFANLLFYGGLAITLVLGVRVAVRGLSARPRRLPRAALGGTSALVAATLIVGAVQADGAVEWSRTAVSPEILVGTWRRGATTLELRADSTFACTGPPAPETPCALEGAVGRWSHVPLWAVTLREANATYDLTLLRVRGHEHLIMEPGDPDSWTGDLGFRRDSSERSASISPAG